MSSTEVRSNDVNRSRTSLGTLAFTVILSVLSLAGAALIVFSTRRYGVGLSTDSVGYISAARNLVAGAGLRLFTGVPLSQWPPLYPALLAALAYVTRTDPVSCARGVDVVSFALTLWLSGVLIRTYVRRTPALCCLGVVAVLTSRVVEEFSTVALSEVPFYPCVLLFLICAHSYARRTGMLSVIGMALSAAAASLLRWPGSILILLAILQVLAGRSGVPRRRLLGALGLVSASAVPLALWLAVTGHAWRYLSTSLHHAGAVRPIITGSSTAGLLLDSLRLVAATVPRWYVHLDLHGKFAAMHSVSTVILMCVPVGAACLVLSRAGARGVWSVARSFLRRQDILILFTVLYALVHVFMHTTVLLEIDDRELSPIFVPTTVLLLALLDRSTGLLRTSRLRVGAPAITVSMLCIWLLAPALNARARALEQSRRGAWGYSTVEWRESPTIDFVERMPASARGALYSNAPDALYILKSIKARYSPFTAVNYPWWWKTPRPAESFTGAWPEEGSAILVWFSGASWRQSLFTPSELASKANLDTLAVLRDGTVYAVSPRK